MSDDFFDDGEVPEDLEVGDDLWDTPAEAPIREAARAHRLCFDSTHPGYGGLKSKCNTGLCAVYATLKE